MEPELKDLQGDSRRTIRDFIQSTCKSPGLHCSSIQEKTQPDSSAKLCIETCWLNDWNSESMNTWGMNTLDISIGGRDKEIGAISGENKAKAISAELLE